MKKNDLFSFVGTQLTDYQRENYPLYQKFMEAYYEFLGIQKNTLDVSKNIREYRDLDTTLNEFVEFFVSEYIQSFPKNIIADEKLFIKNCLSFYQSKGTPKATELFFRIVYNEIASVSLPQEQMLRASDSKWNQETSFRILSEQEISDNLFLSERTFTWENQFGRFSVIGKRYKKLYGNVYEIFFNQSSPLKLLPNDIVKSMDFLGVVEIKGKALKTVSNFKILTPGRNFKKGQIFNIPGSDKNTIFRVIDTGVDGELVRTQIVDYGYVNPDSEVITLSPFSFSSVDSGVEIETVGSVTSITINDVVNGLFDDGASFISYPISSVSNYFAENYLEAGQRPYFGQNLFNFSTLPNIPQMNVGIDGINAAERERSLATLQTISDTLTTYPGEYLSNTGTISDSEIKLQDSYYYQIYSYVINSQISIEKYKDSLTKLLHPAGQIFFSNLNINSIVNIKDDIGSFVNVIKRIQIDEIIYSDEDISKQQFKPVADGVNIQENFAKNFSTSLNEIIETSDITEKSFTKSENDFVTNADNLNKSISQFFNDTSAPTDVKEEVNNYSEFSYFAETYVSDGNESDVNKTLSTTFSDFQGLTDVVSKSYQPTFSESTNVSDDFSGAGNTELNINDSVSTSDSISKRIVLPKQESVTSIDTTNKNVSLDKFESVTQMDETNKTAYLPKNENTLVSDEQFKSLALNKEDTQLAKDQMAPMYAAEDYFAELYAQDPEVDDVYITKTPA